MPNVALESEENTCVLPPPAARKMLLLLFKWSFVCAYIPSWHAEEFTCVLMCYPLLPSGGGSVPRNLSAVVVVLVKRLLLLLVFWGCFTGFIALETFISFPAVKLWKTFKNLFIHSSMFYDRIYNHFFLLHFTSVRFFRCMLNKCSFLFAFQLVVTFKSLCTRALSYMQRKGKMEDGYSNHLLLMDTAIILCWQDDLAGNSKNEIMITVKKHCSDATILWLMTTMQFL